MPAIAIAAGIAAAGSVAGAAVNASASKDAAKTQAATAAQALAVQQQVYNTTQAQRAPYVAEGQAAVGQLGQIAAQGAQRPLPLPYGATYANAASQGAQALPSNQLAPGAAAAAAAPPPLPVGRSDAPTASPVPSIGASATTTPGMVLMRAPTGEIAQVPAASVAQLQAAGATLVTGGAAAPSATGTPMMNSLNGYGQLAGIGA